MRIVAYLLIACAALAQTPTTAGAGKPVALVRFQVAPQKGKLVTDLRAEDVVIKEDGELRNVVVLQGGSSNPRDIPVEVSLLLDCNRADLLSGALNPDVFEEELLKEFPNVSVAIYGFSPGLSRLVPLTRKQPDIVKALGAPLRIHPLSTFLMDHISRMMLEAGSSPGIAVRIVGVVSTGQTDQGSTSEREQQERYIRAVAIAQRANIWAYPVVLIPRLSTQDATPNPPQLEVASRTPGPQITLKSGLSGSAVLRGAGNFANLGSETGGKRIELLSSGNMLSTLLKEIANEIRDSYVAGFEASMSTQAKPHKIEVVMRNKDRARISSSGITLVY